MRKQRQDFQKTFKRDIAVAYAGGKLSVREIEAKGIRMGNVYRWVKKFVGARAEKSAAKDEPAKIESTTDSPIATPELDIRALTKKQLKRGANGRYDPRVKASVLAALETMSVGEVAEITKITEATLYLWKPKKKKTPAAASTALVPVDLVPPSRAVVPVARKAEVIINSETTDALLTTIRKSEGFANLQKAAVQLKQAFRNGLIDDYDEIDLRLLLGFRQLTGAGLRQRK